MKAVKSSLSLVKSSFSKYSVIRVFSGLADLRVYSNNTSLFPPSSTQAISTVLMDTMQLEDCFLSTCLEGFLYGKISVLSFPLYPCYY